MHMQISRIIFFLVRNVFFSRKIEVYIKSNFHFSISIDIINHFNATNIKKIRF